MYIKEVKKCAEFTANDNTILRELLHPDKELEKMDFRYSLAYGLLKPGTASLEHKMITSEVYYILRGTGILYIDEKSEAVYAGCAIVIPSGSVQFLKNTGDNDLTFLCIVDPAWQPEDELIIKEQ